MDLNFLLIRYDSQEIGQDEDLSLKSFAMVDFDWLLLLTLSPFVFDGLKKICVVKSLYDSPFDDWHCVHELTDNVCDVR